MSAMSERAAVIDQLIADLPAEDLKALAERLASQIGYVLVAEVADPHQAGQALTWLQDANAVHLNMLRGGIAKLTPGQIGHLYRGEEAVAVVGEIRRQNPDAFRPAIPAEPRGMKCPHCNGTGELEVFGIGDLVKARRKAAGMTQEELSGRTSISRAQIANIEAGRSDIPVKTLMRLADGIGCKAGDLLP